MDTITKMAAARTRLILDKPFFGALTLRLPLVEAAEDRCRTTWSDGKTLFYNRAYIDSLDIAETRFALSRESLHCALLHFYRRGNRDRETWDKHLQKLSTELAERLHERARQLIGHWNATPFGESMTVYWPE